MVSPLQPLTVLLPLGYTAAAVFHGMAFAGDRQPEFAPRWRRPLLLGVLATHLALFLLRGVAEGGFVVANTWTLISAVALATSLLYALIAWRQDNATVGAIVLGLVAVFQLAASAFGPVDPDPEAQPPDLGTVLHVATSTAASAALILSGLYGLLHLLLYRQMRARTFGALFRQLPNLEQLARMTRRAALAGFLFLTVGLNVGIAMAHELSLEAFDYRDPQVLLTLGIWIHFGAISLSQRIRLLSARRASIAAAVGLLTLIAALLLTLLPSLTFHALR